MGADPQVTQMEGANSYQLKDAQLRDHSSTEFQDS
jgi:hypothetical protein